MNVSIDRLQLPNEEQLSEQAGLAFAFLGVVYLLKLIGFPFRLMVFTALGAALAYLISREREFVE